MSGTMRPKQMTGPGAWDKHQQWRWAFAPIRTLIALYLPCLLFFAGAAIAAGPPIETIDALWAGFDPRATPLDVEVVKVWDEGDVHLEMIYFTGEMFEGEKTRVFGYLGRPKSVSGKLPGILHIHGGGQTANLEWPRFWARRGFVCLTFDFCGDTSLPTRPRVPSRTVHPMGTRASRHDEGGGRHPDVSHPKAQSLVSLGTHSPSGADPAGDATAG